MSPPPDPLDVVCLAPAGAQQSLRAALSSEQVRSTMREPTDLDEVRPVDGSDPDCVVVVVDAPGTLETVVERLRRNGVDAPVVVASAAGSESLAAAAVRADVTDYVPIDAPSDDAAPAGALLDRIRRAAARSTAAVDDRTASTASGATTGGDRGGRDAEYRSLLAETLPDEAFVIDEDGRYLEATVRPDSGELCTIPGDDLVGRTLYDAFPADVADELLASIRRAIDDDAVQSIEYAADTTRGRRHFEGRVHPVASPVDDTPAVIWLARDVTARVERERRLRDHRDELDTLLRINAVVGRVIETLVEAPTRTDVERAVCTTLAESDLYLGAWIGERTGETSIAVRTGEGSAETYLDALEDPTIEPTCPVVAAFDDGEIHVTDRVDETVDVPEPLREAASADAVRSEIVVPITHDDTTYGVLVVLSSRDDAFGERERRTFGLLGETVGFVINAVKTRRLLFADSIVQLDLRIERGDTFSFDLSDAHDCTVSLEWAGATATGDLHQYVTIAGLDGETVCSFADDHETVERCRLIHDGDDRCTIEIRLSKSGVRTLTNYGAKIRDVTVEAGVGRLRVEVPRDVEVRRVVESVRELYEETELVARREVDRPVVTADAHHERIVDDLTDRQLTALRLAFFGGYFEWPRGSTGEEIADAMGVSAPTMHQHLRKALSVLLNEFFEEPSER